MRIDKQTEKTNQSISLPDKGKRLKVVFAEEMNTIISCVHVGCPKNYFFGIGTRKCLMRKIICVMRVEVKERYNNQLALKHFEAV